ncbi:hypothetical protein ACP70R_007545 [Stipagrostis hirtigluma subsp. patula]
MENPQIRLMTRSLIRGRNEADKIKSNYNFRIFTENEIERITRNYSTPIGKGGFGEVYKGTLDDDYDQVAVKKYIRKDLRDEFMEEVSIHSQMNHKNVVKPIGYCLGESSLVMVTEYVTKGNLEDLLHNSDIPVPLDIRLGIAIGCAEALSYMHSMHLFSDSLVCHGDIKPANILLDDNLAAKLSDFGLSRLLSGGITRYTSKVIGSIDYMDPIYLQKGVLTSRSDVYSFGIVLLELISRKRIKEISIGLIGTLFNTDAKGKRLKKLFDARITNRSTMKVLQEIAGLATECLSLNIRSRPQMNDVAKRLWVLKYRVLIKALKERHERVTWDSILATHRTSYDKGPYFTSAVPINKMLSFIQRCKILNVRIFTEEELCDVTQNYSYRINGTDLYKGTLDDNSVVAVQKVMYWNLKTSDFMAGQLIQSQVAHRNIIRFLGCCLEAGNETFIYECAPKYWLPDILYCQEDFPIDLRMKIAVNVADALEYLHSSVTGIIGHGDVAARNIFLDNNFIPMLTGFSQACRLTTETEITASGSVNSRRLLEKGHYSVNSHYASMLTKLKKDVHDFGVLLLSLIGRKKFRFSRYGDESVVKLSIAYGKDNSGKAMFGKDITAKEDIVVLEEIGRLAMKCTALKAHERPTMKAVTKRLQVLRRYWKKSKAEEAGHVTETSLQR